jgi:flagellar assembly protein FliH
MLGFDWESATGNWQLMPLIKSPHVPSNVSPFSMRDVENVAKATLMRAQEQAEALLLEAQREAELLKTEGYSDGLQSGQRDGFAKGQQEGTAAGTKQALAEHKSQLTNVVTALTAAVAELDASRRNLESDGLREVVALAVAIARRVTKRQGLVDPDVLTENLREAMKLVAHGADVRIAINPQQKAVLESVLPQLRLSWPDLKHVELIDDAALCPGGCRIFTARGSVDADLDAQLDRVVNDLLPAPQEAAAQ